MNLIEVLTKRVHYNPELAYKHGISVAVIFNSLLEKYGTSDFTDNLDYPKLGMTQEVGQKVLESMHGSLKLLTKVGDRNYRINFEVFSGSNELDFLAKKIIKDKDYIVFHDPEFNKILNAWNEDVLRIKGRKKSKAELSLLFNEVRFEVAIEALRYAYNNKFTSLNFEQAQRIVERGNIGSSESKRADSGDGRGRGIGTFGPPKGDTNSASAISKRVSRPE